MPIPSDVHFKSLQTDKSKYKLPLGGSIEPVKIHGYVANNGLVNEVNIIVTKPDGTNEDLNPPPMSRAADGYFQTFLSLYKNSQIGKYTINATYLGAKSDEVSFQVVRA